AIDLADEMGISIEELQGYILGESDAVSSVNEKLDAYWQNTELSGHAAREHAEDANYLRDALDSQSSSLSDAEKAAYQKKQADDAAGLSQDNLADSTAGATGEIEDQTDALNANNREMEDASGKVLSLRDAERRYEESLDTATESLKNNGSTLDITTEKGRKNQAA